jgi:D-alanyl-D-alanine dipeptidase
LSRRGAVALAGAAALCLSWPQPIARAQAPAIEAPAPPGERPGIFRIQPQRPIAELRREAKAARPPVEAGPFRPVDLVDLAALDRAIRLDVRYATADNFLSTPVYESARAFLQRPAAEALFRAHRSLARHGYGLLVHDAYRPWWVTRVFWDATPADKREFVADPAKGSRHNRGCAVDLTLYELASGRPAEMPSLYDEMTERASPGYSGGTPQQRARRDLLRRAMEEQGFTVFASEWWHFDHRFWREYPILNLSFEEIDAQRRVSSSTSAVAP